MVILRVGWFGVGAVLTVAVDYDHFVRRVTRPLLFMHVESQHFGAALSLLPSQILHIPGGVGLIDNFHPQQRFDLNLQCDQPVGAAVFVGHDRQLRTIV